MANRACSDEYCVGRWLNSRGRYPKARRSPEPSVSPPSHPFRLRILPDIAPVWMDVPRAAHRSDHPLTGTAVTLNLVRHTGGWHPGAQRAALTTSMQKSGGPVSRHPRCPTGGSPLPGDDDASQFTGARFARRLYD